VEKSFVITKITMVYEKESCYKQTGTNYAFREEKSVPFNKECKENCDHIN